MKLLVIIPAFNEERTIEKVINRIPQKIVGVKKISTLIVDDGSSDKTAKIAKKHGCLVISHAANFGVGKSLQTGLERAVELKADIAVNIDADGQFDPREIPKLVKPLLDNKADVAVSNRFHKKNKIPKNMPVTKYYGNLFMTHFINFLINANFEDVSSGFRAYNKEALLNLNLSGKFTYTQEMFIDLSFKGLRIINVPVSVRYFKNRKSKVADSIVDYSLRSLKIIVKAFRDYKPMLFFLYLSLPFLSITIMTMSFLFVYYLGTGSFTPYKIVGFVGVFAFSVTILLWLTGFLADMFVRIRVNQERIIYQLKKQLHDKK